MKKWKLGKLTAALLCLLLFCGSFAGSVLAAGEESVPQISSGAAVVADLDSGAVLYEENSEASFAPANLTKIMTVLLLTENYDLSETVSFSEILYETEEGSDRLGLQPGEEITLYDAACAIWLENADDVANGVAEYVAGSREAFAEQMNLRAQALGCQNTSFSDPNGYYSQNQYTCASDLSLILQAAWQNAAFREISGLKQYEIPATNLTESSRYLYVQTSQQMFLVDSGPWKTYLAGGLESAASGGTEHLTAFCSSEGRNLAVVVLGAADAETAVSEAETLAEYGFSQDASSGTEQNADDSGTDEQATEEVLVLMEEETDVQTAGTDAAVSEDQTAQPASDIQETQVTDNALTDIFRSVISAMQPVLEKGSDALQVLFDYVGNHPMETVTFFVVVMVVVLALLMVRCFISFIRRLHKTRIQRRRNRDQVEIRRQTDRIHQMDLEDVQRGIEKDQREDQQKDQRKGQQKGQQKGQRKDQQKGQRKGQQKDQQKNQRKSQRKG